jgi:hypothetical protein
MDRAGLALMARTRKDYEEADRLFKEALDLELKAIETLEGASAQEPTYSILHRSAATLALDCNDPRFAEKLISKALAKDPPAEIVEELRDLMEQVHFRRHLILRGITIAEEDEMQMSLAGQGVGFGIVHSHEFLQRVDDASKLIYRIVERRQNRPFRERGRLKQVVKDDYEMFLSVPRAASFAVTLKLGRPATQQRLPGISDTADIVDEFMELMILVNKAKFKEIEKRIPDQAYRTNFVQLAKRLAPDGNNVSIVGFTAIRDGRERFVEVTRAKPEINIPPATELIAQRLPEKVTVRGVLRFADATHRDSGHIKIVDESTKNTYQVKVPEGMMNDIVKPLWDTLVVVKGIQLGQYIMLEDIEEQ